MKTTGLISAVGSAIELAEVSRKVSHRSSSRALGAAEGTIAGHERARRFGRSPEAGE